MTLRNLQVCMRCVYNETVPGISFDDHGICNYCRIHDELEEAYPTGNEGRHCLESMVDEMRRAGRGKPYDCIVGVSGGCDSSYLVHKMVELGARPLAVHFDNTWNSPIATQNIYNVLTPLGVELFTIVVDNKEYDDIYRSFMLAGVKDIDAPTDIGLIATMYAAASKFKIRYIVEGHSFRTEGISPLGWLYMDGKFISSIHNKFGRLPMRTYPNLTLYRFLKYSIFNRVQRMRPLYYMDYDKEKTKRFLSERYGWHWYGGHHLENRFTAFFHSYFMPKRYGIDLRVLGYAALVRSGQLERQDGLALLERPTEWDNDIVEMVKRRLDFSDEKFEAVMTSPERTWRDYPTYKKTFERLRPLFWVLLKAKGVPESFYMKFCLP